MTMYADSVFQNQGDQIQNRKQDLISVSVYPLHAEYSQRSVRLPGPPGAVIRRLLDWAARMGINPPKDLHGPPRTLVLPDGSIIVRSAGHGTLADAICPFGSSLRLSLLRKVRNHGAPVIACSQSERKFLMKGIQLSMFVPFSSERLF